ncbi:MAG: Gfo/Idh/MocA family oxidoreductase, partial [Candidatus Bathyarchaeia archaeon]
KVAGVIGCFHKLVWTDVTNEDQVEALIRFENGAVANVQISSIASIGKPRWRILGTKGGLMRMPEHKYFHMVTYDGGKLVEMQLQFKDTDWSIYYRNIVEHLLYGAELLVKPEEASRVISIIEASEKSSKTGKIVKPLFP